MQPQRSRKSRSLLGLQAQARRADRRTGSHSRRPGFAKSISLRSRCCPRAGDVIVSLGPLFRRLKTVTQEVV